MEDQVAGLPFLALRLSPSLLRSCISSRPTDHMLSLSHGLGVRPKTSYYTASKIKSKLNKKSRKQSKNLNKHFCFMTGVLILFSNITEIFIAKMLHHTARNNRPAIADLRSMGNNDIKTAGTARTGNCI